MAERIHFASLAAKMLTDERASVAVPVSPLDRSSFCWTAPSGLPGLDAQEIAIRVEEGGIGRAWADRYGGSGLGGNGGSGRAGFYRGLYLKGIGPTPLIGKTTDRHHVSGGAYLEEAVRETVFAELFSIELPWSAVRTQAIVDTFEDQEWNPGPDDVEFPIYSERRVVLVREPFLRPAHLERAVYFTGDESLTGASDILRTAQNRIHLVQTFGARQAEMLLRRFWLRWCQQCAYMYSARLTAGPVCTSNVALDGRLLDFGAASALPDWCATVVYPGQLENGREFPQIADFISSFYAEHKDGSLTNGEASDQYASALIAECADFYLRTAGVEILRLAGLRRVTIETALKSRSTTQALIQATAAIVKHHLRLFRPSVDRDYPWSEWDFLKFWDDKVAPHFQPMRKLADDVRSAVRKEPVGARVAGRCKPRERLAQEFFRRRLHGELPKPIRDGPISPSAIADIVRDEVVQGRRDSRFEPELDILCGFVSGVSRRFALFRRSDHTTYAIEEPDDASHTELEVGSPLSFPFDDSASIDSEDIRVVNLLN